MANKYGRQIFLSRAEIQELRSLVDSQMIGCSDEITRCETQLEYIEKYPEQYSDDSEKFYRDDLQQFQAQAKLLEGLSKKLWFWVTPQEAAAGDV